MYLNFCNVVYRKYNTKNKLIWIIFFYTKYHASTYTYTLEYLDELKLCMHMKIKNFFVYYKNDSFSRCQFWIFPRNNNFSIGDIFFWNFIILTGYILVKIFWPLNVIKIRFGFSNPAIKTFSGKDWTLIASTYLLFIYFS